MPNPASNQQKQLNRTLKPSREPIAHTQEHDPLGIAALQLDLLFGYTLAAMVPIMLHAPAMRRSLEPVIDGLLSDD